MKKRIKGYVEITLGVAILIIGYYFFFLPSTLVTGGVLGLGIILENVLPFPISIFLYIVNTSLLFIGLFLLGKNFFIKTFYATLLSPTLVFVCETFFDPNFFMKDIENKFFVACIAGSFCAAVGLGLCFKNNGTSGGMDVVQKILSKYFKIPYSKTMWLTDFVVILIAGLSLKPFTYNIERVTFGFIAILISGFIVDYIALNAKSRRTTYIITSNPKLCKDIIYKTVNRGVTEVDVRGGYTNENKTMLICTLDKNQSYKLQEVIRGVDEKAFIFSSTTKEVVGKYD